MSLSPFLFLARATALSSSCKAAGSHGLLAVGGGTNAPFGGADDWGEGVVWLSSLLVYEMSPWGWSAQLVLFAAAAVVLPMGVCPSEH